MNFKTQTKTIDFEKKTSKGGRPIKGTEKADVAKRLYFTPTEWQEIEAYKEKHNKHISINELLKELIKKGM